jgi:predicted SnoaL-like aldol condensation-catalyzing enzyme
MRIFHVFMSAVLLLTGSIAHSQNRTSQVEANKKIVYDFYRFVWEPADEAALMKWLPESYIEHNPRFRNGRTDLANLLRTRRKGQPVKVSDTLHDPPELIVAEGELVTWIFKRMRKDPKDPNQQYESFWFDTFRIRDGKIVEHWDGALRE